MLKQEECFLQKLSMATALSSRKYETYVEMCKIFLYCYCILINIIRISSVDQVDDLF